MNRTALCVGGDRVGIYRKGRLDMEVSRGNIVLADASFILTFKFALAPFVGFVVGTLPIVGGAKGESGMGALDIAAGLGLCAASVASLASIIYTRVVWKTFEVPCKSKIWAGEDFCVRRDKAGVLTGPIAAATLP